MRLSGVAMVKLLGLLGWAGRGVGLVFVRHHVPPSPFFRTQRGGNDVRGRGNQVHEMRWWCNSAPVAARCRGAETHLAGSGFSRVECIEVHQWAQGRCVPCLSTTLSLRHGCKKLFGEGRMCPVCHIIAFGLRNILLFFSFERRVNKEVVECL